MKEIQCSHERYITIEALLARNHFLVKAYAETLIVFECQDCKSDIKYLWLVPIL